MEFWIVIWQAHPVPGGSLHPNVDVRVWWCVKGTEPPVITTEWLHLLGMDFANLANDNEFARWEGPFCLPSEVEDQLC